MMPRPPTSTLFPYTTLFRSDPEILGGAPVFKGTRVPVKTLFEYLESDYSVEEFLECFPSVSRRSEEHTSELQSHSDLVCRLLLEKKKKNTKKKTKHTNRIKL